MNKPTRRGAGIMALAAAAACASRTLPGAQTDGFPYDAEIQHLLAERVNVVSSGQNDFCIAVGLVESRHRRFVASGRLDQADGPGPREDTLFEIASVTKVFTALLLADMASRGQVALNDSANEYLPARIRLSRGNGRAITLVDLATHTAGLPFMPGDLQTGRADLEAYVAGLELTREPGAAWDYSNVGYWLLGEALAARGGAPFEHLLSESVLVPLGLCRTGFTPGADLAPGHDASMQHAGLISDIPAYALMPAAGGLYSCIDDLGKFLSEVGNPHSPLAAAFTLSLGTRRPLGEANRRQALGWAITGAGDDEVVFHDGGSRGYASAVAWSPRLHKGVAVLSNQVTGVADVARHLLQPSFTLQAVSAARHVAIAYDASAMDAYIGRYEAAGEGVFIIAREGDALTIEAPPDWGLPRLHLHPQTVTDFFASELPLRVSFQREGGQVRGMLVHPPRGQRPVPTQRVVE